MVSRNGRSPPASTCRMIAAVGTRISTANQPRTAAIRQKRPIRRDNRNRLAAEIEAAPPARDRNALTAMLGPPKALHTVNPDQNQQRRCQQGR